MGVLEKLVSFLREKTRALENQKNWEQEVLLLIGQGKMRKRDFLKNESPTDKRPFLLVGNDVKISVK